MGTWDGTTNSAQSLANTTSKGWDNSAFGVSVPSINSAIDPVDWRSVVDTTSSTLESSGLYLANAVTDAGSIFTDGSQYAAVADAAASASLNFLESKIQRIKDAWLTKDTITVGALIGEISPYAISFKEASSVLCSKLNNLTNYLLGTSGNNWQSSLKSLGNQAVDSIVSDPSFTSSVSNLKAIQSYGNVLNSMANAISGAQKVMEYVEPILPYVEIIADIATSWVNGGASAAKGVQKQTEETQKSCFKLLSLSLQPIRKLVYGIKISLPSLLTGALNSLSIKEAMDLRSDIPEWVSSIFSEEYYQTAMNSLNWQAAVDKSLSSSLGTINDWSNFDFGQDMSWMSIKQRNFLSSIVQNYMYGSDGAIARARAAAHLSKVGDTSTDTRYSDVVRGTKDNSTDTEKSALDNILDSDLDESPLSDEISLIQVSKKMYDYI